MVLEEHGPLHRIPVAAGSTRNAPRPALVIQLCWQDDSHPRLRDPPEVVHLVVL